MSYVATLTVPASTVASSLTAFVTRIDLADMPTAWWTDVTSDLGNVRVKASGSVIPFDITRYNVTAKTGELFFKASLTTSDNVFTVETVDSATALAVTDANGRNAVWVDYDAAFVFPDMANRNGSGHDSTLVGTATIDSTGFSSSATGYALVTGLPKRTIWTMGTSTVLTSSSGNRDMLSYAANGSVDANRATLLASSTQAKFAIWNSSDAYLKDPGSTPLTETGVRHRFHHSQNGTTDRKIWRDGALAATDLACSQRPGSTGDTLFIGADDTSISERYYGLLQYVYLRNGVMAADWLAAEYKSWETPAAFYAVTASTTITGTLSATLPGVLT